MSSLLWNRWSSLQTNYWAALGTNTVQTPLPELHNGVKNEKLILRGCQETALGDEMFPGPCKGGSAQPMISRLCVREGREGRGHECCLWWYQSRTAAHLGRSWKGSLLPVAHLHRKLGFSDHEIYIPAPIWQTCTHHIGSLIHPVAC